MIKSFINGKLSNDQEHVNIRLFLIISFIITSSVLYGVYLSTITKELVQINQDDKGIITKPIKFQILIQCTSWNNWPMLVIFNYNGGTTNITTMSKSLFNYQYSKRLNLSLWRYVEAADTLITAQPNIYCSLALNADSKSGIFLNHERVDHSDCSWIPFARKYDQLAYSNRNQPIGIVGWFDNGTLNSKLEDLSDWKDNLLPSNYVWFFTDECHNSIVTNATKFYNNEFTKSTFYNTYITSYSLAEIMIQVVVSVSIQFTIYKFIVNQVVKFVVNHYPKHNKSESGKDYDSEAMLVVSRNDAMEPLIRDDV